MTKYFSAVFSKSNGHCVYCGKDMKVSFDVFYTAQEDHLVPRGADGPDDVENIVLACFVCNNLRGQYLPPQSETLNREQLLAAIREHVFKRRAEKTTEFLSWIDQK